MALFNRINLNTLSLLNHFFCKFTTSTIKFKVNKHITKSSSIFHEKNNRQSEKIETLTDIKSTPFEIEITKRRDQACRSILVQVYSINSHVDLQNYCIQFGTILSMHHYRTNKQRHYILVEFKDETSVNEIISSASFANSDLIIPVKSSALWFRKGLVAKNLYGNDKKIVLTTENGSLYPTARQISHMLYHSKSISGQILHIYDAFKLNELEIRLRFHTAHHLEEYFSRLFYGMKVLPFGSSINGFGRKRCDLDLVLILDDINENISDGRLIFQSKSMKIKERYETKEFMGILANTMQHFIPGIENVRKILEARVPIIKFNFEYTNLECDLSTTNMSAVYMSELLNLYGEIDWRVRPLVLIIRKWAKAQEITCDSPGPWITNFSLSLLVLFYLQQKNILPSLKMLRTCATRDDARHSENGIDCTFMRNIQRLPNEFKYKLNQDNLEHLLFGFLEYFSTFDFYMKGICIREGIPIRKPSCSALYIVNPLETTLNVSKNVSIYELNRLTEKAHDAVFTLETSDKSRCASWGLMSLLKIKSDFDVINITQLNTAESSSVADNSQENHSHEISEKIVNDDAESPNVADNSQENHSHEISEKIINDDDIQPKKKEETV